jgi:hypothetical protein
MPSPRTVESKAAAMRSEYEPLSGLDRESKRRKVRKVD